MYRIMICDDQKEILKATTRKIKKILSGSEISVECFDSAKSLLSGDVTETDLFVLDIGMPDTDGFVLAEQLNRKSLHAKIIFLTSEADRVFDGYKYRAFRFVVKGDEDGFKEAILSAFKARSAVSRISLNIKNEFGEKIPFTINKEHIIYFEYNLRRLSAETLNGRFEVIGETLSEIETRLSSLGFVCVHRSYLVNMAHIVRFDKNDILLSNGEKIYIGSKKTMVKEIKQQYFRFLEDD